jgi:hypothetical protein
MKTALVIGKGEYDTLDILRAKEKSAAVPSGGGFSRTSVNMLPIDIK